ncbi:hypothetical protein [Chitinophaga ginsengisoli]|uniref:Uncharacterized protein n=1 Tax=Chitinophaga ginsengisoli TaxID=363837 RepID=A0A2P8GGA2_9BACT|nr:hypothetical protein [Chitinophaga ginsengisoli]PSL33024.1 hypothetical protein CLV42_1036 [Chitinophaga ginsengisoli]
MEKRNLIRSKISGAVSFLNENEKTSAIINVKEADYIPNWLKVRNKITSFIFTSEVKKDDLAKLEEDQRVVSISLNQQLNMIP